MDNVLPEEKLPDPNVPKENDAESLRIIAGLGNPGPEYERTRHNIGFQVIRNLSRRFNLRLQASRECRGLTAEGRIEGRDIVLLMPLTYMNRSGQALRSLMEKRGIPLSQLLVVCDDFHLPFGALRLRRSGSDGGHNGLGSVIASFRGEGFARLRFGVGAPDDGEDSRNFVLGEFSRQEEDQLPDFVQEAADCCLSWLTEGCESAMNRYNRKPEI